MRLSAAAIDWHYRGSPVGSVVLYRFTHWIVIGPGGEILPGLRNFYTLLIISTNL